ncbi:MAG TPA: hypothetical protein VKV20_14535 [Ktedonobacteraceae bacterium]|nr:hypothetical protein [Ktedonobacteraceae bacterium]
MKSLAKCIILFFLLLTGCGSVQTGQSSALSPMKLQVVRVNTNRYAKQYPPYTKTIQNAVIVQQIYRKAFTLPKVGPSSCGAATGSLIYRLDFFLGKELLKEMNLGVISCQFLKLSKTDIRYPDSNFLFLLKQALHLNSLVPGTS